MESVTSSVPFPAEVEGVAKDVIVVLVPTVLLIGIVEENSEIVYSLE